MTISIVKCLKCGSKLNIAIQEEDGFKVIFVDPCQGCIDECIHRITTLTPDDLEIVPKCQHGINLDYHCQLCEPNRR